MHKIKNVAELKRSSKKIEAYAHTEHNLNDFKDPKRIEEIIRKGASLYGQQLESEFVKIDENFPPYLQEHQDQYSELILR